MIDLIFKSIYTGCRKIEFTLCFCFRCQLWAQLSQIFLNPFSKFLCLSCSKFPDLWIFMAKFWKLKMLKFRFKRSRFHYESNPKIICLAKIKNPNPNIQDSEEKIWIQIRILVTTLIFLFFALIGYSLQKFNIAPKSFVIPIF